MFSLSPPTPKPCCCCCFSVVTLFFSYHAFVSFKPKTECCHTLTQAQRIELIILLSSWALKRPPPRHPNLNPILSHMKTARNRLPWWSSG